MGRLTIGRSLPSRPTGSIITFVATQLTSIEVAAIIGRFLDGTGGRWEWDDFTSISILDPVLDGVRRTCGELPDRYPPPSPGHYCGEELAWAHYIAVQ